MTESVVGDGRRGLFGACIIYEKICLMPTTRAQISLVKQQEKYSVHV